jgi:hypothetical protein
MLFTIINGIVVIVYLGGVCYLAYKGRRTVRLAPDHMIAGQERPTGVLGISHGATLIGTTAIIGFGGTAAMFGFSLLWVGFFSIVVGVFIAFAFLGRRTRLMGRALNAYTFPEVLGERYQSPFIQGFAGIVVFAFIPIFAAAILIGMARLIEVSLHIPYLLALAAFSLFLVLYVILGGFRGVKYIDAFHGVFMLLDLQATRRGDPCPSGLDRDCPPDPGAIVRGGDSGLDRRIAIREPRLVDRLLQHHLRRGDRQPRPTAPRGEVPEGPVGERAKLGCVGHRGLHAGHDGNPAHRRPLDQRYLRR